MVNQENESLKESQRIWSELYGREITLEETQEINRNLRGYFDILYKWSLQENENKECK